MILNWTSKVARFMRKLGLVFRTSPYGGYADDADARRMKVEFDAIRARFPDHS